MHSLDNNELDSSTFRYDKGQGLITRLVSKHDLVDLIVNLKRWREDLDSFLSDWPQAARDKEKWKALGEAFAQQWDSTG
ncbi:hypothetical protein B5X24_HaOG205058 [Helicoverpa armigera]|nr:hypothetical protein B5X24_HaOG205058 [Helicoverpa armigera]